MRLVAVGSVVIMAGLTLPALAAAQYLETSEWARFEHRWESPTDSGAPRFNDYRVDGAVFGAFALGVLFAGYTATTCNDTQGDIILNPCGGATRRAGLIAAGVGGVVGYLIGRNQPRGATRAQSLGVLPTQRAQPDDYRMAGAVIGAVFFGVAGGWALHEACKTQPVPIEPWQNRSCTGSTAGGAAAGAALGAGLGYLAGRLTHRR